MARSMTGFGKAEVKNDRFELSVEARNLNNRFLDMNIRLPKALSAYEFKIKDLIKANVLRGKLNLTVNYKNLALHNGNFMVKAESVKSHLALLEEIINHTGIKGEVTLDHLLSFKELWEPEEPIEEDAELESELLRVIKIALDNLNEMRDQEAENISGDIIQRLQLIETALLDIETKAKLNPREELKKLYERTQELLAKGEVDKNRFELELALIADRVDVTEECIRLRSHMDLFRTVFKDKPEVGKQLTFILQEMQRESNTIGSKTTDVAISHKVIRIKEEIEKLREQVQNLE